MKTSLVIIGIVFCLVSFGYPALAQQPWCWGFEALDGFTTGSYSFWKYSNKERPPFYVPPSDDGYIWTRYLQTTSSYKPQIVFSVTRKVTRDTTFSLRYYLNKMANNVTINFIRSGDNAKIRVGTATTASTIKNETSWLAYSGKCDLCCEVDVQTCNGQFEILGTSIFNGTELALGSFSINGGSCEMPLPKACYDFKNWGEWTNANNWNLDSGDKLLHPNLPPRDGNYAWLDTTNPPTSNLTSPLNTGVSMATKLSIEYFMTDSQSIIRVYFLKGNNFSAAAQMIDEFTGSVDNEWDHREIKCQLANGAFCCGKYSERCDGYFLFETSSKSDGIIALDNVGVNDPNCGNTRAPPGYAVDGDEIISKGAITKAETGRGRFNFIRKDQNSFLSFNYNF